MVGILVRGLLVDAFGAFFFNMSRAVVGKKKKNHKESAQHKSQRGLLKADNNPALWAVAEQKHAFQLVVETESQLQG